jgi:hypothetical protein
MIAEGGMLEMVEEGNVDLVVDDAGVVTGTLGLFDGMQSSINPLLQVG